jgi:hypothetical protein
MAWCDAADASSVTVSIYSFCKREGSTIEPGYLIMSRSHCGAAPGGFLIADIVLCSYNVGGKLSKTWPETLVSERWG